MVREAVRAQDLNAYRILTEEFWAAVEIRCMARGLSPVREGLWFLGESLIASAAVEVETMAGLGVSEEMVTASLWGAAAGLAEELTRGCRQREGRA